MNGYNHHTLDEYGSNEDADLGLDNILANDDPFLSELGNILNEEGDLEDPFNENYNLKSPSKKTRLVDKERDLSNILASCEKDFFNVGQQDNSISQRESPDKRDRLDEFIDVVDEPKRQKSQTSLPI